MKASTLVCCFSGKNTNQCIKNGSGRLEVFCEKGVLRNVAKFTEKHLCQSLFFNKVVDLLFVRNTSGRLLLFFLARSSVEKLFKKLTLKLCKLIT